MAEVPKGMFWDVIAGRAPLPPVLGLLGWNVVDAEPGHVRAGFQGKEEFYNPVGLVQGGILAAMLDGVMGAAAVSLLAPDESITTLEMNGVVECLDASVKLAAPDSLIDNFAGGTLP